MLCPYKGRKFTFTSPYGVMRTILGVTRPHKGIDLVGIDSKEIVAIAPGVVVRSRMVDKATDTTGTWEWGNYVAIQQDDGNVCYYCHMDSRKVSVGQKVKAGDVIGIEGATGRVTGRHLHLEIRNSSGVSFNIASYIGIPNQTGTYTDSTKTAQPNKTIDYATEVCKICGFEQQTKNYINAYKYASDLWRKIYEKLKK